MRATLAFLCLISACAKTVGDGDGVIAGDEVPQVGWIAVIDGQHHNLSGTATIVDETTIELAGFTYDGGGINSRLFLLTDGGDFHSDFELTDNLVGDAFSDVTMTVDIPPEATFDDWNLISLWCIPAAVSFGSGVFEPPE
jgi:hypothetical protein